MISKSVFRFIAIVFLLFSGRPAHSQDFSLPSENNNRKTLQMFDRIVGRESTGIFNGVEYIEKQRMVNEKHKFWNSFDFQEGTVFYEGQPYYNIPIKYNVPDNLLLVRLLSSRGENILQLYNDKLDGFVIGGQQFINFSEDEKVSLRGIYELLEETPDKKLLKKHHMKYKKILEEKLLYYEFEADDPEYFYIFNNQLVKMNRKALQDSFPENRKEIRKYYRTYTKSLKDEPDFFMTGLFQVLKELTE